MRCAEDLHVGLAFCARRVLETVWVCETLASVKVHSRNDPVVEYVALIIQIFVFKVE